MKMLMLLKKVSVHGRDFVTPSTVINVKKRKSCRNKKNTLLVFQLLIMEEFSV